MKIGQNECGGWNWAGGRGYRRCKANLYSDFKGDDDVLEEVSKGSFSELA